MSQSENLFQNRSLTNLPKGFSLVLKEDRPRVPIQNVAALIKALVGEPDRYKCLWKSNICGTPDFQWIQAKFAPDYNLGFFVRNERIMSVIALVTPSGKEFNTNTDRGPSLHGLVTDEEWIKLTDILIQSTERRVLLRPCWMVCLEDPVDKDKIIPFGTMYDHGAGKKGHSYPKCLEGGPLFYDKDKALNAEMMSDVYYKDMMAKKKEAK